MKLKLIPDWKKKLRGAWSSHLALVGMILSLAYELLPQVSDLLPRRTFLVLYVAIFVARFIYQEKLHYEPSSLE